MSNDESKRLFLVDAYALIFRSYYAFMGRPMRNGEGLNTSAVFGFTKFLRDIIKRERPRYLGVAFDPKGPDSGDMKVLRGGSFLMGDEGGSPMAHRITSRQRAYPGVRDVQVGFRVVWDVE